MPISDVRSKFNIERTQDGHLSLIFEEEYFTPFSIDFSSARSLHRIHSAGKKQALARAVGIKKTPYPAIIDATAGLGMDAFIMAALGCQVTLIEQSPIVAQLLQDALDRAGEDPTTSDIVSKMILQIGNAYDIIPTLPKHDVIYIDPMFPESGQSAKVKKPMQILQNLVGHQSEEKLLDIAKHYAKRVVLKRPKKLNQTPPKICQVIHTKTIQFWIFHP